MKISFLESVRPFVEFLQSVGAGRIKGLRIAGGLPVLEPPPTVIREVRFGPGPDPHEPPPEVFQHDLALTVPMVQLLWCCRQIGEGTIDTLYVSHGLPKRMFLGHQVSTFDAWRLLQPTEGGARASA